jgi:MCP family monocarboxylic acid transporter-like MFS transporter 12
MNIEENNSFLCEKDDKHIKNVKKAINIENFFKILIIIGSFIIYFIADGVALSSGILIRESSKHFNATTTQSSVTASLLQSIPLFLSPIVCILIEKYGCRIVATIGSILVSSSFVVTKFFVHDLISLYFAIGCLASCGLAMCYIPAYLILSFYFDKRRALAIGIAVSGSGLGVFAMPPIMELLIGEYGWLNACLIFGAISSLMLISACLFRPLVKKQKNEIIDEKQKDFFKQAWEIIRKLYVNKKYLVVSLSYTLLSFLITAPYNFLPSHVSINSINDKYSLTISFIGIATVIGQLVIGFIADKYLSYNWLIYSVCLIVAGLATCILPLLKNLYLICMYSVVFGFMTSVNYVLQSNLVIEAVGIENLTYAFGCIQLSQGVTTLTGTPLVAWLKDISGNYNITFFISGIFICLSGFCLLLWPVVSRKKSLNKL